MMNVWNWLADGLLALLLSGTLVMAIRLDRGLRVVRRDRAAFETLISSLGAATGSVSSGIQALRNEAERAAEEIERRSSDADKMATDLSFLVEAADRAGAKLEQTLQSFAAVPADADHGEAVSDPVPAPKRYRSKAVLKTPGASATPEPATDKAPQPCPEMAASAYDTDVGTGPGTALANLRELAGITRKRQAVRTEPAAAPYPAMMPLVG
jgi:Domain of unknown function (DUF6468)